MDSTLITDYQQRVAFAQKKATEMDKQINTYSLYRLIVFGAFLVGIYISVDIGSVALFLIITAVLAVFFNWLVRRQDVFEHDKAYYQSYEAVNKNELDNAENRSNIYPDGTEFADDKHYYTADLDIFGRGSLFQLANRAATPAGRHVLAAWFNAPAPKATILSRQAALKELTGKNDWKLDLQARLLFALKEDTQQLQRLLTYLQMPVELESVKWLKLYSKIVPWLSLLGIVLSFYFAEARYATALFMAFNNRLTSSRSKEVNKADLIAGKIGDGLKSYADAFQEIEQQEWYSELAIALAQKIKQAQGKPISARIRQLAGLINNLNQRLNMVLGFLLNVFLLWNIRQVIAIEEWKRDNHQNLEAAFASVAEFEALISLAGLQINNTDWTMPEIVEGESYTLTAKVIAHPLIKSSARVANNYELADTFKIDLITGSNMAGKSTFLRTLGINTVLALAGAPVCASAMQVSVVQLFSYMRIKDSLNESTSTFKAELDRLQMLLAAVNQNNKIFFLIDEMLRGTNSVDKYLGSKAVIEQLIARHGVGLVATHDLQLAELEKQYPDYVRNFYFDIQVLNGEMLFDYKLKPGECKTFNASLLLEQIGIPLSD
ncbi:DNA mismatch repair protein MutS [Mucilaginibacter sp. Bleaf8]|uniref:MutS-related protein n=1 Tax=Mucilaginibacter sp. Bleaf8 TaxID=2834430 RepID=UPI001BCC353F|nr:DNA mismatch repair protein MutS [Mucilaginibacter sp. Bleaf8]MBS7566370.1 DNA mismatch repair protein MutS [Mucilaginibacter sp. Bleaf8]